jgi:hypothetical protein
MSNASFQWEKLTFRDLPVGNPLTDRNQILQISRSHDLQKLMAMASGVSAPRYGKVVGFVLYVYPSF